MKQVNVGILGATGAVGQEMIKILEERNFPVASLRPIASARSAGSKIMFRGQECTIVEASDDAFEGLDIVLGAAENDIAERFAPSIVKAGAVFVDNSSAFRLDPNVPLVIPEINPEDVKWHKGIISNPNCTTIVTLVAINASPRRAPSRRSSPLPTRPSAARARAASTNSTMRSRLFPRANTLSPRSSSIRSRTTSSPRSAARPLRATPARR